MGWTGAVEKQSSNSDDRLDSLDLTRSRILASFTFLFFIVRTSIHAPLSWPAMASHPYPHTVHDRDGEIGGIPSSLLEVLVQQLSM